VAKILDDNHPATDMSTTQDLIVAFQLAAECPIRPAYTSYYNSNTSNNSNSSLSLDPQSTSTGAVVAEPLVSYFDISMAMEVEETYSRNKRLDFFGRANRIAVLTKEVTCRQVHGLVWTLMKRYIGEEFRYLYEGDGDTRKPYAVKITNSWGSQVGDRALIQLYSFLFNLKLN
jgi:hypothetical protein